MARGFEDWLGTFADYSFEIEDLLEAGDLVVQHHRESGRGKGSGALTERKGAVIYTVRSGEIVRVKSFPSKL